MECYPLEHQDTLEVNSSKKLLWKEISDLSSEQFKFMLMFGYNSLYNF